MGGMKVSINPEIIRWVLQKIQFENITNSVTEILNKWLTGEKTPTFNQVETVSKQTRIPFGYFFLETPPEEACPIVEYRTSQSLSVPEPSRNLMATFDAMQDIQDWMRDYLIENGQKELAFVNSISLDEKPNIIAGSIRNAMGLEYDWFSLSSNAAESFKIIRTKLEDLGILVLMNGVVGNNTKRTLSVEEFRAFTLIDPYAPLIFINTRDTDTGKLFSLVHEAVHIWIGQNSFYNNSLSDQQGSSNVEKICNTVAAEILVPEELFQEEWKETDKNPLDLVHDLAKAFKCSRYVIAKRALDTGNIPVEEYNAIVSSLTKQYLEWKKKQNVQKETGGNYYNTLGSRLDRRLVNALASSAREGRTDYMEVYRLTNTNRQTFEKLIRNIGGFKG